MRDIMIVYARRRSEYGSGIAIADYPHNETQLYHRPVTGRLRVVRIGDVLVRVDRR